MAASTGITLKVEVRDAEVRRALGNLARNGRDLEGAFTEIGEMLLTSTHRRFETHRDPAGQPWQPLAPSTIRKRQERNRRSSKRVSAMAALSGISGVEPLFVRGRLFRSIQFNADESGVAVGTNLKFKGGKWSAAAIHQLGGTPGMAPGPAAIPARPFLGINDDDERGILRIVTDHMARL